MMNFAVRRDHRVNLKQSEKRKEYVKFDSILKNLRTWKWRSKQFLIGALLNNLQTIGKGTTRL